MSGFSLSSIEADLPNLGIREFSLSSDDASQSHTTVIIGRNGSGKSTILREVVAALRLSATGKIRRMPARSMLKSFSTKDSEKHSKVNLVKFKNSIYSQNFWNGEVKLPAKLLALSFTPFDKFPPSGEQRYYNDPDEFYVYLGFKTENGRSSPRLRLLKNIDQLAFRNSELTADVRACRTLSAIGYEPRIKINYSLSAWARTRLRDAQSASDQKSFGRMYSDNYVEEDLPIGFFEDSDLKKFFPRLRREEKIEFLIDFSVNRSERSMPFGFQKLRDLLDNGILTVGSIEIYKLNDQNPIDLLELSSGELNILSGFFGMAAHLVDDSLILIDEPENSLHPAWQIRYIQMLEAVLESHRGCHCIIATHSPLILSGAAAKNSIIVRLDQDPVSVSPEYYANQSPDLTLVSAFDVVTSHNNYIKQIVLEGLTLIENGEAKSQRSLDIAGLLSRIVEDVPAEDPIRGVIEAVILRIAN